jgi:hypothetical protein
MVLQPTLTKDLSELFTAMCFLKDFLSKPFKFQVLFDLVVYHRMMEVTEKYFHTCSLTALTISTPEEDVVVFQVFSCLTKETFFFTL